jgi:putative transposase
MIDEYHNEIHLGIGTTPLQKFESHYFGAHGQKRDLPRPYVDDAEFRRYWYPLERRSLQRYGIRIEHLDYYGENISLLVRNRKKGQLVQVRRNPFDVREIYVFHPVQEEWLVVPTRHLGFPIASIFELRQARAEALRKKRSPTPEELAKILDAQAAHIEEARRKTKSAQRDKAKRAHHSRIRETHGAGAEGPSQAAHADRSGITLGSGSGAELGALPRKRPPAAPPRHEDMLAIAASVSDDDLEGMFE